MKPSTPLMSRMLWFLPARHASCFFLQTAFLKCLPADIRAHLVQDRTSDPLTLTLHADKIFQSRVSSTSALNHVSSTLVLGEEFPFMLSPHKPLLVLLVLLLLVLALVVLLMLLPPLATRLALSVLVPQISW